MPLYTCFVGLQKAYDSVDRELAVEGTRPARDPCQDDGRHPPIPRRNAGPSANGRRRTIGLVPRHTGAAAGMRIVATAVQRVFLAAPLEVIVVRFGGDKVITKNLVFTKEETGAGGPTTLVDKVRRALCAMLYADDAGVV